MLALHSDIKDSAVFLISSSQLTQIIKLTIQREYVRSGTCCACYLNYPDYLFRIGLFETVRLHDMWEAADPLSRVGQGMGP